MSMAMFIICLVLGVSSFISFLFNRREPTKVGQRITGVLAVISFFAAITVNGGAKLVHPGGAKLVHLTLCGTQCWGVVPVVHRRDPRCFV